MVLRVVEGGKEPEAVLPKSVIESLSFRNGKVYTANKYLFYENDVITRVNIQLIEKNGYYYCFTESYNGRLRAAFAPNPERDVAELLRAA